MVAKLQHTPLRRRRYFAERTPGGDPWTTTPPGPRGLAPACAHLLAAGVMPLASLEDLRAAWPEASEDEREAIITTVKAVAA